ncbi:MAG: PepSY domain-containing protein [Bacillota bacterium]
MSYVRVLENGLENPHEVVNILLYRGDGSIGYITRFNKPVNTLKAEISEEEALKSAAEQIEKLDGKVDGVELVYYRPNFFWSEESYEIADFVRLSYKISLNEGYYFIYVDAVTGEVTGGDEVSDSAGSFGSNVRSVTVTCSNRAANKFILRGYSPVLMSQILPAQMFPKIKTFVQDRADAYGFYFCGHGSYHDIGDVYNGNWTTMESSAVEGNWKFVVLDACSTAKNATWSNAFKIYTTSTNKAFVGWSDTGTFATSNSFNYYFWYYVGGCPIQWAMKCGWDDATDKSAVGHPRFTGHSTYYGNV